MQLGAGTTVYFPPHLLPSLQPKQTKISDIKQLFLAAKFLSPKTSRLTCPSGPNPCAESTWQSLSPTKLA